MWGLPATGSTYSRGGVSTSLIRERRKTWVGCTSNAAAYRKSLDGDSNLENIVPNIGAGVRQRNFGTLLSQIPQPRCPKEVPDVGLTSLQFRLSHGDYLQDISNSRAARECSEQGMPKGLRGGTLAPLAPRPPSMLPPPKSVTIAPPPSTSSAFPRIGVTTYRGSSARSSSTGGSTTWSMKSARDYKKLCADVDSTDVAAEYIPSMIAQLFRKENECKAIPSYLDSQADINNNMRGILIDWIVTVHEKQRWRQETLFLTINLIDRYLSKVQVPRTRLQLTGVVALFIAAKFDETTPPRVESLSYVTDNACSKEDILRFECKFLAVLEFRVFVPTAAHFLCSFLRYGPCEGYHRDLSQYVLELSLMDVRFVRYEPSRLAAAALCLCNELLGHLQPWPSALVRASRYSATSLVDLVESLRLLLENAPRRSLQGVRKKYSHVRRHSVATGAVVTEFARPRIV